ncbi:MAG TPA: insulinase family protein [Allosphingosinicella sp.]|jgi:zinc protease
MIPFRRCLLAMMIVLAAPVQAAGDGGWFYRGTDITPDPAWVFGTLPNGMRYAVRRNPLPAGQVSIRLRIDAGALHEQDQERGWAHYIEHMAFRGTKSFKDGEAREIWQKLGANFGSDTNASTEPTQTVYQLDLPHADRASLDTSLHVLSEMADNALFTPSAVEAEKGVILSERGRRPELNARLGDTMRELFYAGLKFANRDTIGTEETLKAADAEGLRGYYERWYRPERATLVMVGDADTKLMEELIAARFGGWQGTGPSPKEPDYGTIAQVPERAAALAYPGAPHLATMSWVRPYRPEPHTKARERVDLARALSERILNRRLEAKARGEAAFLSAQVSNERSANIADYTTLSVMAKEGRWTDALNEAYAIIADALRAPPSATEIAREVTNLRTAGKAAVEGDPTLKSQTRAQRMINALDGNSVITSSAETLALFEQLVPAMTPAYVGAEMKSLFAGAEPRMVLLSPQPVQGVAEALAAAERIAPAARQAERNVTMDDLPKLGKAGREVSRDAVAGLDATIVRFANGSSLVFKQTPYEKGSVNVQLRFGSGYAGLPNDRKTIAWMAGLVGSSGIGELDLDAIERMLTGRRISMGFGATEESFVLRGTTDAPNLQDQLRLLSSKLAFPRWDRTMFQRYKTSALENYDLSFSSAAARAGREFPAFTRRGDLRWAPIEREDIARATPEEFERFFAPLLQQGPIEAVVVGDVDLETVVKAMASTVAALPPRPEAKPAPAQLKVQPPVPGEAVRFTHQGDSNQAYATIGWSTFGGMERPRERRALALAANMLQVRLFESLRATEGATYSPSASSSQSESFDDWGLFYTGAEIRPERADLFFRLARETVADMAAKPADSGEWERAINPVITGIERRLATNAYWFSTMENWSRDPRTIEQTRSFMSDYRSMTPEEVRSAVAKYVSDAGDWSLLVLPGKADVAAPAGSAPAPAAAPAKAATR